jgi:hypothetical protein
MMTDSWFYLPDFHHILIILNTQIHKHINTSTAPKTRILILTPSHIPYPYGTWFYSPFFGFNSPWIDENSGHRGRRVPLYQERRRTWSVVAGGNMTKTGMIYSSPQRKNSWKPGNLEEHIHGTHMGGFV